MLRCFWNAICNCPTNTPTNAVCGPCAGYYCSMQNGVLITSETQVQDPFIDQLIQAIARMDTDAETVERIRVEVRQIKSEIERKERDLQQQVNNATNHDERKAAVEEAQRTIEQLKIKRDELVQKMNELGDIADWFVPEIEMGMSRVIIPYSDPYGYCQCYVIKLARLNALATQITTTYTTLNTLQNQTWPTAKKNALVSLVALVFPVFAGIMMLLHYFWVVVLGIGSLSVFPPIAAAIALIFAMMLIFGLMLYAISVASQIVTLRKKLLQLILSYYRLEQIPTCQKTEEDEDGHGDDDENDHHENENQNQHGNREWRWWQKYFG